jgi:nitrate reductase delta subunit
MHGLAKKNPARLLAIDQVGEWTRERFGLARGSMVHVWEIACAVPGCPPLETVVGFSIAEQRYQFRVFKPLEEVSGEDLPPPWFKGALAVAGELDCDCC